MYYICEDPVSVIVRNDQEPIHDTDGRLIAPGKHRITAKFRRGEAPSWAWPEARTFPFAKLPVNMTAERWVSFYDSVEEQAREGWTNEERELVEAKLATRDYIVPVEPTKASAPYPAYQKHRRIHGKRTLAHVAEDIRSALESSGIPLGEVFAYERDHADEHSNELCDLLMVVTPAQAEAEEVVLA